MEILDIIILICFIPAIVEGISKGFIRQVVDLASIILGAWAAFKFSNVLSEWLTPQISLSPNLVHVLSFAIIVIVVCLVLHLLGGIICKIFKMASLGWVNGLLGFVLSIFKAALIIGLVIMVFEGINAQWHLVAPEKFNDAVVYNAMKEFSLKVFPFLKSLITGQPVTAAETIVTNV